MGFKIDDFKNTITSPHFLRAQDELARLFQHCIVSAFKNKVYEPKLVEDFIAELEKSKFKCGHITLKAKFIHGNRYQVVFDELRWKKSVELGDLLFIASINKGGKTQFRRISFCQAKKNKTRHWDIDKDQLFLLSNFPPFHFKNKSLLQRTFSMENNSACLGSHSLFNDDDIFFISSKLLDLVMAPHNPLKHEERFNLDKKFCLLSCIGCINHRSQKNYFSNTLVCCGIKDFVNEWTRFNIGEWVHSVQEPYYPTNPAATILFNEVIRALPKDEREILGLNSLKYGKNEEGNRQTDEHIGIIHLAIDVDERPG